MSHHVMAMIDGFWVGTATFEPFSAYKSTTARESSHIEVARNIRRYAARGCAKASLQRDAMDLKKVHHQIPYNRIRTN